MKIKKGGKAPDIAQKSLCKYEKNTDKWLKDSAAKDHDPKELFFQGNQSAEIRNPFCVVGTDDECRALTKHHKKGCRREMTDEEISTQGIVTKFNKHMEDDSHETDNVFEEQNLSGVLPFFKNINIKDAKKIIKKYNLKSVLETGENLPRDTYHSDRVVWNNFIKDVQLLSPLKYISDFTLAHKHDYFSNWMWNKKDIPKLIYFIPNMNKFAGTKY